MSFAAKLKFEGLTSVSKAAHFMLYPTAVPLGSRDLLPENTQL